MSNSLDEQTLWEATKALVDAPSAAEVRQILAAYPELQDREIEPLLTRKLRHAWRSGDVGKTRDFLACRTFLQQGWRIGLAQAVAQVSSYPMAANSGFGRLLQANDLQELTAQAKRALVEVDLDTEPEIWADLHVSLANYYLQSKGKERIQRLEDAIWHGEQALAVFERLFPNSPDLANALHLTGIAYSQRTRGNRSENLHTAVRLLTQALTIFESDRFPNEHASVQHNLGNAWFWVTTGDRKQNIEKAIDCYQAALTRRTYRAHPVQWMMTTHQLGLAYIERIAGSRMANVEQAISYCQAVLRKCSEDTNSGQWGRCQVALGNAFVRRLKGDRTQNIEKAIDCYQQGIRTLGDDPDHWAMAHSNLAVAYFWRAVGDPEENLQQAEEKHQLALSVYTKEEYPIGWARTLTNLGNLYWRLYVVYKDEAYLYTAVEFLQDAETVRSEAQDPIGWALIQHILGNIYADWPGKNRYQNLQKATVCYQKALTVRTRQAVQGLWAETTNNLGTAYTDLVFAGYDEYAPKAIACYEQALAVHTPEAFPFDCRRASRNLARLLFLQEQWEAAADGFQQALAASEYLYQAGVTPVARQVELEEIRNLPLDASFSLAKAERWAEAVVVLEKNRARALGEALVRREAALATVSEEDRSDFIQACGVIATWEAEVREYNSSGRDDFLNVSTELEKAREALTAVIQRIRRYQPDFLPEGLSFKEISAIAATLNQPIVYLVTTVYGSVALCVPPNSNTMNAEHVVWCESFHSRDLQEILQGQAHTQGYLNGIESSQVDTLKQVLSDSWSVLQTRLMAKITARLQQLGFARAVLVPTGQLSLLPLHAFSEDFVFSVAPSARSLQSAVRYEYKSTSRFLGIGNPQPLPDSMPPLAFAQMEVEEIAAQFPEQNQETFVGEKASLAAIQNAQAGTTYLHFACHGAFHLKRPLTSALFLANDENLTLDLLLNRKLDLSTVQLVILSACKTGVIEFDKLPDELIGFPAGFLQVGVPAVISTLWAINDVSTLFLMATFYHCHLTEGLPPADALKGAQRWLKELTVGELRGNLRERLREMEEKGMADSPLYADLTAARRQLSGKDNGERPYSHPYYWASFVYTGP